MPTEPNKPEIPSPKTFDQLLAEMLRENERLRRQIEDARHERDEYKKMYLEELARNAPEISLEDLANAVPARPVIDQLIHRLEAQ